MHLKGSPVSPLPFRSLSRFFSHPRNSRVGRCPISEADISACENVVNLTRLKKGEREREKKDPLSPHTPDGREFAYGFPEDSQTARVCVKLLAYCRSTNHSRFSPGRLTKILGERS